MNKHGVDTSHVKVIEGVRTGVAVIIVESSNGENRILINPGANGLVVPAFFASPSEFLHPRPSIIVMQLEIPLETVLYVCREAKQNSIPVLLNPAPAIPLPASIYEDIAILVVNETEASMLSGIAIGSSEGEVIQHAHEAAGYFLSKGCPNVIVTLGALGAIVHIQGVEANPLIAHIPAVPTKVVDTTAAGDTFIGAVAVAAAKGWVVDEPSRDPQMLLNAVKYAVTASSWTVARKGTWDAMPRTEDLE
ncbi:Ribokinase-like protein [Clavulina sp. PMI_390]|nr:Ribokinase-like protein [Clavulina sp. PMI_390]